MSLWFPWGRRSLILQEVDIVPDEAVKQLRISFGTAIEYSNTSIPAGSRITFCRLSITQSYSSGATISVGNNTDNALLLSVSENDPQYIDVYSKEMDVDWGAADQKLKVTINGSPSQGSGVCTIYYCSSPKD